MSTAAIGSAAIRDLPGIRDEVGLAPTRAISSVGSGAVESSSRSSLDLLVFCAPNSNAGRSQDHLRR